MIKWAGVRSDVVRVIVERYPTRTYPQKKLPQGFILRKKPPSPPTAWELSPIAFPVWWKRR